MAWNPCDDKIKDIKWTKHEDDSYRSAKNYLEAHGAIDKYNNIKNLNDFRSISKWLNDIAIDKGHVTDRAITEVNGGKQARFDAAIFKKIDGIKEQVKKLAARTGTQASLELKTTPLVPETKSAKERRETLEEQEKQALIEKGKLYPISYSNTFKAIDWGSSIEGKPQEEANKLQRHFIDNPNEVPEGSTESFNDATKRVITGFRDLVETAPSNTVVITNSSVMRIIDSWKAGGSKEDNSIDTQHYLREQPETGEIIQEKNKDGQPLYFIRHGNTLDNDKNVERTKNTTLNQEGIEQAKKSAIELHSLLKGDTPTFISSSLERTKQTSDIITQELARLDNKEEEKPVTIAKLAKMQDPDKVAYALKVKTALESDKVRDPSKNLQGFYNDLEKQGVPKDQIEIIKSLSPEGKTKDQLLVDLAANYSYTVEVKTAKQEYEYPDNREPKYDSDGNVINEGDNTQYYSNMIVPGGTNYTENEIRTPDIIPSIKGHAQFSTDNGLGWFRSDIRALEGKYTQHSLETQEGLTFDDEGRPNFAGYFGSPTTTDKEGTPTKTRRIIEIQSDYGQKQRKSSEPDIHIKYDINLIIKQLEEKGEIKRIDC